MLNVDLQRDEDLRRVCNQFISSVLPHENYNSEYLTSNLLMLFQHVHLEEFHLEHFVLLSLLDQLSAVRSSLAAQHKNYYEPRLTRERLEYYLESFIPDSINSQSIDIVSWLNSEGLQSNLNIPQAREQAQQKLYGRVLELYDECFEMKVPSETVLDLVPTLKECLRFHVAMTSISTQATILQNSVKLGRKTLSGSADWLQYTREVTAELDARLKDLEDNDLVVLDSIDKKNRMMKKLEVSFDVIAQYGIPVIDKAIPIVRHRLVVIVGQENVGKTSFAIGNIAMPTLLAGGVVCYMHSETTDALLFAKFTITYVYQVYNTVITEEHVLHPENCPEHVQKMIGFATTFLSTSGKLVFRKAYHYSTVKEEIQSDYDKCHFDTLIIDHSCRLKCDSKADSHSVTAMTANVNALASAVSDFRNDFPVCIAVLSHPASDTKKAIASNKTYENSPTKYSQDLSTEADDLFILTATLAMRAARMANFKVFKRRGTDIVAGEIALNAEYHVSTFLWRAENQASDMRASATAISVLEDYDNSVRMELENAEFFTEGYDG